MASTCTVRTRRRRRAAMGALSCILAGLWAACTTAVAQEPVPDITAKAVASQIRRYEPGKWGVLKVVANNHSDRDGELLLTCFFAARKDLQFARRVWVPANSLRTTWLPIFTPAELVGRQAELYSFQLDSDSDTDVIQRQENQTLNQTIPLNIDDQEGKIGLIVELPRTPPRVLNTFAEPEPPRWDEVVIDANEKQSFALDLAGDFIPPAVEMLEELDHAFLNTNKLRADSAGLLALRHWVQRGGRLWVCLNTVDPDTVRALAGGAIDIAEVDRVSLDTVLFEAQGELAETETGDARSFDPPVEMVRVVADGAEVTLSVDGYPAAFWARLGEGEILFTTLDAPAWVIPRPANAPGPRNTAYGVAPSTPWYPTAALRSTVSRLYFPRTPKVTERLDLATSLSERIGYKVMPRWAVLAVLGVFCTALILTGGWLSWRGRLDHLAWAAPLLALPTAALLMSWSLQREQVAPPTIATTQIVRAIPATEELDIQGVSAIYRPDGGEVQLGGDEDGLFQPDLQTADRAPKRMVWSDAGQWSWRNLVLPKGQRLAEQQGVRGETDAVRVVATFDANGLTGRLSTAALGELQDLLLFSPVAPEAAPTIDGERLSVTPDDVLAEGQFLSAAVVDDVQRQRSEIYSQIDRLEMPLVGQPSLLAWCKSLPLNFTLPEDSEREGSALAIIPLELQRPQAGAEVLVPSPFIRMRGSSTVFNQRQGRWLGPVTNASTTDLRCELPDAVLPLQPREATVTIKMNAPSRRLTVSMNGQVVHSVENPTGEFSFTVSDPEALRLDDGGALPLTVKVGYVGEESGENQIALDTNDNWKIDFLRLDVRGQVGGP